MTIIFTTLLIAESEESKFVYLGFQGEGQPQSLIAVFENGKVFGIADLSVDSICHLAHNEPSALSGAIRKMKFLKCELSGNFPIRRAEVYHTPTLSSDRYNKKKSEEGADDRQIASKDVILTSLSIAIIDSAGDLFVGSIGSVAFLDSRNLTQVTMKTNYYDSIQRQILEMKNNRILDIAIIDSAVSALVRGGSRAPPSKSKSSLMAMALCSNGTVVIIDLEKKSVTKTFSLNIPQATKICIMSAVHLPSAAVTDLLVAAGDSDKTEWSAIIFGLQASATHGTSTNIFVLLRTISLNAENLLLRLCGADSLHESQQIELNVQRSINIQRGTEEDLQVEGQSQGQASFITSSAPGDFLFRFFTENGSSFLSGTKVAAAAHSCVRCIINGLTDSSENSEHLDIDKVEGEREDGDDSSVHTLLGKIICLSLTDNKCEAEGSTVQNPFGVEELLEGALEKMISLHTCGQVAAIVNALFLCVVDPPEGYLYRAIDAAEVNQIISTNGIMLSELLILFFFVFKCLDNRWSSLFYIFLLIPHSLIRSFPS